jgi:hypothetical protein
MSQDVYFKFKNFQFSDLTLLVQNSVQESNYLDYKSEGDFTFSSDKKSREFLCDIAAFANTFGGVIIFGINEQLEDGRGTGYPDASNPFNEVNIDNIDIIKSIINSKIKDSISPRPSVDIHFLESPTKPKAYFVLIKIYPTSSYPCMVTFQGLNKFYGRNSTGKYPLDVIELSKLFNRSNSMNSQLIKYRDERIEVILDTFNGNFNITKSFFTAHFFPEQNCSLPVGNPEFQNRLREICHHFLELNSRGYNFNGPFFYKESEGKIVEYLQISHNGFIEYYSSKLFRIVISDNKIESKKIFGKSWELNFLKIFSVLNSFGPILEVGSNWVFTGLFKNVHGFRILLENDFANTTHPIAQNTLSFDTYFVDLSQDRFESQFLTFFDRFWQSANFQCSPYRH